MTRGNIRDLRQQVRTFNAEHPKGTRVRFWLTGQTGVGVIGHTRGRAHLVGGHTPSVGIVGVGPLVALERLVVEPEVEEVARVVP